MASGVRVCQNDSKYRMYSDHNVYRLVLLVGLGYGPGTDLGADGFRRDAQMAGVLEKRYGRIAVRIARCGWCPAWVSVAVFEETAAAKKGNGGNL